MADENLLVAMTTKSLEKELKVFLGYECACCNAFSLRCRQQFILSWNVNWMVKWKLKLNSLQRMHRLCVCWLRWRMSTQSLWRLQVSWAEISLLSSPHCFFLSQPACPEKFQRDKGKGCSTGEFGAGKYWTRILICDAFVMRNWDRLLLGGSVFPSAAAGLQCRNTLLGVLRAVCSL